MVGNWYPQRYENSGGFRRDMGISALFGWLFCLHSSPEVYNEDIGIIVKINNIAVSSNKIEQRNTMLAARLAE